MVYCFVRILYCFGDHALLHRSLRPKRWSSFIRRRSVFRDETVRRFARALSIVLASVNYVSLSQNIAAKYDEIIMITIAVYTFSKLAAVIVKRSGNMRTLAAACRHTQY